MRNGRRVYIRSRIIAGLKKLVLMIPRRNRKRGRDSVSTAASTTAPRENDIETKQIGREDSRPTAPSSYTNTISQDFNHILTQTPQRFEPTILARRNRKHGRDSVSTAASTTAPRENNMEAKQIGRKDSPPTAPSSYTNTISQDFNHILTQTPQRFEPTILEHPTNSYSDSDNTDDLFFESKLWDRPDMCKLEDLDHGELVVDEDEFHSISYTTARHPGLDVLRLTERLAGGDSRDPSMPFVQVRSWRDSLPPEMRLPIAQRKAASHTADSEPVLRYPQPPTVSSKTPTAPPILEFD
ncbi:hypothetical protein JX266_002771 [Neoarthrinium moseri]|nr:hypothetical protein JX266_002771 [Neoarthrinium moseri]